MTFQPSKDNMTISLNISETKKIERRIIQMMEYLLEEVYKAVRLTLKEIHAFLITDRPLLETFIGKAALFRKN